MPLSASLTTSAKEVDKQAMETPNGTKPQDGQAMTADEREEARLVRLLEMLDNLHVWVRSSYTLKVLAPANPMEGLGTSDDDTEDDRTSQDSAEL